jgi:adenylate cyclase
MLLYSVDLVKRPGATFAIMNSSNVGLWHIGHLVRSLQPVLAFHKTFHPAIPTLALLGDVFCRFDGLAAQYGLEKIKTTGDGYMVAGGLPEARTDHAAAVAEMAFAMLEAVETAGDAVGERLQLRVGLNTGALIAGVLGTHKFVYDVWGDTVNTAKRMESYGVPGQVHVSAATRLALGDAFRFEPRGPLDIKGKGLVETYFLYRHE